MSNPKTEFPIVKRIRKIAPLVEQVATEMGGQKAFAGLSSARNHPRPNPTGGRMSTKKFQYVTFDDGRQQEHFSPVITSSRTAAGFLRLFYLQETKAPRGDFFAELRPFGAEIFTKVGHLKVALFKEKAA